MLPRVSLLEELKKGGYEASLITTYNAYLPFYEDVVLRRLVNSGVRHNVLLMDARQYSVSLTTHPPRFAGRNYTLAPVSVGGAFHPKLIFLSGKSKGLVLVGSHNMTLAGFGFNRELTNVVRVQNNEDAPGIAVAQSIWAEIDYWLDHFTADVPKPVKEMVRRVRDFAPWLKATGVADPDVRLLGGRPGGQSLWEQFRAMIAGDVTQVALSGPFFDARLEFLARVKEDLRPKSLAVAIEPQMVQIPARARTMTGLSLMHATSLGADDKGGESGRYLHAKGIFVQQADGDAILAVGSANPSAPAWLASAGNGNVELMIARRGEQAASAAKALGLAAISALPPLNDADWLEIGANAALHVEPTPPGHRTGVAVVEDDRVSFDMGLLRGFSHLEFVLAGADGHEIRRTSAYRVEADSAVLGFTATELVSATALHGLAGGELVVGLLLHHVRAIEEQARTGTQRRFREALQSLETDTPNLEAVLDYVHKIVASKDETDVPAIVRRAGKSTEAASEEAAPETLAIDVSKMKTRKAKKRLLHSGDLAYLLDALIYGLRLHEDKTIEELDRFGRSEEEQIGADDDQDATMQRVAQQQDDLLRFCHAKVGTVISRMIGQLEAFTKGQQSLAGVALRLLAVLAVLRELRSCDGRVAWVEKGRTTVPEMQRLRLLEAIMFNVFERNAGQQNSSLLNLAPLGDEFEHSDDVARLKGLVLWLAWDCGLTLDLRKPFMESREHLEDRLRHNAMVLALAQMIRADEVAIDEARQSIGSLTSSELNWLKEIQQLAGRCAALQGDLTALHPAEKAEPGDIAIHRKSAGWDLRIVSSAGGNTVALIRLAKDGEPKRYRSEHLVVGRLGAIELGKAR